MHKSSSFTHAVIAAAITAPSGGNNQPWKFFADDGEIFVVNDRSRASSPTLDVGERATYAALGAAVENMVIAAAKLGQRAEVTWLPRPDQPLIAARLRFEEASIDSLAAEAALFDAVHQRLTNRRVSERKPIPEADLQALREAAEARGCGLQIATGDDELATIGAVVGESDAIRVFHDAMRGEMLSELRWSPEEVSRTRDGMDLATLEVGKAQRWLFSTLRSPRIVRALEVIGFARGLVAGARKLLDKSSAFAIVTTPGHTLADYLQGGRAMQRVWLTATRLGLAFQPLSAVAYLFNRVRFFGGEGLPAETAAKLHELYSRFAPCFPQLDPAHGHVLYFRLGYAGPATARSLRRPVEDVLVSGPPQV